MLFDIQVLSQVQLLEHLPAAVFTTNAQFIVLSWNYEAEKVFGWLTEEVVGKPISAFLQLSDTNVYSAVSAEDVPRKDFWTGQIEQQHKQGTPKCVELSIKFIYNPAGLLEGTISVGRDITRQQELEADLRKMKSLLEAATRNSPIILANQDIHLSYTYFYNQQDEFEGVEAIGKTDEDIFPETLSNKIIPIKERVLRQGLGEQHEITFSQPSGTYTYLFTIDPVLNKSKEITGITTAAINISSYRKVESSLEEKETQLEYITNALPILIAFVDAKEHYKFVNQNYESWFGIPKEYMLGKTLHEVAGDDLYEKHKAYYKKALNGEKVEFTEQVLKQGISSFLLITLIPFISKSTVKGFYVLAQDQTELLTIQTALEESNQVYQTITHHFPKGNIFILDHHFTIIFAEGGSMRERGLTAKAFVGKTAAVFVSNEHQLNALYAHLGRVLQGETITFTDSIQGLHYEFTCTPLPEKDGRILRILCIVRNISEQVKLQQEVEQFTTNLQEAQQLAKLGFWEYYPENQQLKWSEMMYEIFDKRKDEPVPMVSFFKELVSVEEWNKLIRHAQRAHSSHSDFKITIPIQFPSGKQKYVQLYARPLEYLNGLPYRLFGAAMDVTEQSILEEKVKEQEAQMNSLFESDTVGIIFWDISGKITHANDYFLKMLGYTRQHLEAGEVDWRHLTPVPWEELIPKALQIFLTASANTTTEKEFFHKSGKRIPVLLGSAFLSGYYTKGASFVLDITELQNIRRQLEQKALALKDSNSELEKFAYVAAHDLQEPLNTLSGLITLLDYQASISSDEEMQKLLTLVPGIIGRMQQLIKSLLEYSKIDSAKIQVTEFAMEDAVKVVLDSLAKRIADTDSVIVYDKLPVIHADQAQITQLIQNLIGNAIKFRSHKPMHIEISGHVLPDGWQFSIRDTGIGMNMADASKIFGAFQRLHTRNEYEGTGLGLAICQKIVERHKGKIWVESVLGEGSTFYFTLCKPELDTAFAHVAADVS
jgi:PAS domain S-box-containing protein